MTEEAEDMDEAPKAPKAARPYCQGITDAQKAFEAYQTKVTNIEKRYATLEALASIEGDREFQIFWANMEVLKPTIYTRAPQPVVAPRQRSSKQAMLSRELTRASSELLERVLEFDVEDDDLHDTLLAVRDDLALGGRGVPWVLDNAQCIHVDREDFVHEPARKWKEVGWVARRAYLDRDEMRERFPDADLTKIKFRHVKDRDDGNDDYKTTSKKAEVWEVWHKTENAVIWVHDGYPDVLDVQPPLIEVKGFFPCPKPAYSTLEPRTLKPVPDFVYYRDQVDEINELTARMSSLAESLRLKGFYAAGTSEIGEAIEAAMKATDNKTILVPVSNFAALGGAGLKDAIVWLPVREVAEVITNLVALRRQLIEDVYEITGLSDIMRGSTQASETATAQNLKAQFGSVRVRERQAEMVRVARDVLRLKAEIYAETVPAAELAVIAQMQFPTFEQKQEMIQQAQAAQQPIDADKIVTIEEIDRLLKDQRIRPFVLDVESDSTIAPNEEAEKSSRIEFIKAVGGFIQQAGGMVAAQPETAPFAAEMLKFAAGSFRGGRELMGAVDEFAALVAQQGAKAAQGPSPEQQAAMAEAQSRQAEAQAKIQIDQARVQTDAQAKQAEHQLRAQEMQINAAAKAKELEIREREVALKERDQGMREREVVASEDDVARLGALEQAIAASTAQMAAAVEALTQQMAALADQVTAPRRGP